MDVLDTKIEAIKHAVGVNEIAKHNVNQLIKSLSSLTVAGIQLFACACLIQGLCNPCITTMAFDFPKVMKPTFAINYYNEKTNTWQPGALQEETMKAMTENFFLWCAMVASCAAIGHVMMVGSDSALKRRFANFLATSCWTPPEGEPCGSPAQLMANLCELCAK